MPGGGRVSAPWGIGAASLRASIIGFGVDPLLGAHVGRQSTHRPGQPAARQAAQMGAPTAGCPSTRLEARGPGSAAVPPLAAHCCLSSPSPLAGCPLQGLVPSHCHHSGLRTAACDSGDTTWSVHNRCQLYALPEQPLTRPPLEPGGRVDARRRPGLSGLSGPRGWLAGSLWI